ncbi:gon-4 like protein muscle wasted [Haematobia irritans]|uniref:gon-4 like protein muscle wasted n=1 Tax=Haematobia irritans TaxID=7368 RepID=UPI003F4F5BDA
MRNSAQKKSAVEKQASEESGDNSRLNTSGSSTSSSKSRKRKRCEILRFSDLESEFDDCDLEDAVALETRLRKVARKNSLSHEEMMKLLQKFVKNEHILALVTLKAEHELAKEKSEADQTAILITDTPSIPKLTRSKAKELNKQPVISLPKLLGAQPTEIATLITEELNSDEEDEEYTFKEEDFVSDDDPNTTASDLDSNPRTPQTPILPTDDSPVKLTEDGCFKVPLLKKKENQEELRIATRTRSKLCLQQTTIEDIESEFIPPDVEIFDGFEPDNQGIDEEWNQFLTDFLKPLNSSVVGDDDDPINDPEYIAAEKEKVDAEELRDVNISKKEIAELMAELLSNLNEGISFESIEVETPRKFVLGCQDEELNTPNTSFDKLEDNPDVNRQLNLDQEALRESQTQACSITPSINVTQQNNFSFHPDVMSTPSSHNVTQAVHNAESAEQMTIIPLAAPNSDETFTPCGTVAIPASNINNQVDLIAVPIPGQPNCYQLAKIISSGDNIIETSPIKQVTKPPAPPNPKAKVFATRYTVPYETNYCGEYISVKRHIIAEYKEQFETLKHAQVNQVSSTTSEYDLSNSDNLKGFSKYQYDLFQQQLRIHVQTLTQTFVQTYCHPELWRLAKKPKDMLLELQTKSKHNANFKIWNLEKAVELVNEWQHELNQDTEENKELMQYLNREVELTNHNTRQIPRFHPRMLECFLNSDVFMYPEYLPRMPFSSKVTSYEAFSPVESYLIAMGLEKHVRIINERKERIPNKSTPLRMACKRLTKDTLSGKQHRRVWAHMMHLKDVDYYNPIKYYFEHNKAPPVEYTPIIGFENNTVLPPKDRYDELPLVFQTYLQKKNEPPKPKKTNSKVVTNPRIKASDAFRDSYLEFVREAVGEDITLPTEDCFVEATEPEDSASVVSSDNCHTRKAKKRKASREKLPKSKRRPPHNVTINVNYVFGGSANNVLNVSSSSSVSNTTNNHSANVVSNANNTYLEPNINETLNTSIDNLGISVNGIASPAKTPVVTYNFDLTTKTLHRVLQPPATSELQKSQVQSESIQSNLESSPQIATTCGDDICPSSPLASRVSTTKNVSSPRTTTTIEVSTTQSSDSTIIGKPCLEQQTRVTADVEDPNPKQTANANNNKTNKKNKSRKKSRPTIAILAYVRKLSSNTSKRAIAYREKRRIKQRCEDLITAYGLHLETLKVRYKHSPLVQLYYNKFKALELYTNLLKSLKMICNKNTTSSPSTTAASGSSPSGLKRSRTAHADDESSPSSQRMARKINRQEESFRHMLLPDTPDEANRKDAIYAFNFYEKVEEAFKSSNRADDCKKFNSILKSFDPKKDKVSDLYNNLEKLFLPDHPELAQVFLTFLLPSDAAEIGKFFEHFMITNMTTFINKLNVYFNKQPAQIRKIYNCLNELSEDPDVTMKKIETRIIPLLKGNQFLIDWFMQQFPKSSPPERLFSTPEHILNVKEQQSNRTVEHVETITDLMESPSNEAQTQPACQLRYINGRIFYGSKMLLPAKLSFMAASFKENRRNPQITIAQSRETGGCVHAIMEHGEKCLQSTTEMVAVTTTTLNNDISDDPDKSEEEDISKVLVIDTTAEEEDSCSLIELCDENALKAHALRLNPSYYGSGCYSSNATSTPNLNSNFQSHHPNAKKVSLNFTDETGSGTASGAGKTSPRKNSGHPHSSGTISSSSGLGGQSVREKRKSPSKKTKSPLNNTTGRSARAYNQPMVVIHENNTAIQCAKRLKSLVEASADDQLIDETPDSKEHVHIVAKSKHNVKTSSVTNSCSSPTVPNNPDYVKQENSDDMEFLPENASITRSPFPVLKMDTDSEDAGATTKASSKVDSDEDCKIDLVANLVTQPTKSNEISSTRLPLNTAWTRDEDKAILIEMKLGSSNREELYKRIVEKLPLRTLAEIKTRHLFLMDFLSKLQGK